VLSPLTATTGPGGGPSGQRKPCKSRPGQRMLSDLVRTSFTYSRAHLRRARPDGQDPVRAQTRATEGQQSGRDEPGRRPRLHGSRRCGAAASPRPSDAGPTSAAAAARGVPATGRHRSRPQRPRCRAARAGQAVGHRARCASRQAKGHSTGPERRALSGAAPPPARAPEDPF
jgi:hypothetical protein